METVVQPGVSMYTTNDTGWLNSSCYFIYEPPGEVENMETDDAGNMDMEIE